MCTRRDFLLGSVFGLTLAQIWLLVLSFTLSQIGQRSVMSVFWTIPPIFLGGTGAAAGIGLCGGEEPLSGGADNAITHVCTHLRNCC